MPTSYERLTMLADLGLEDWIEQDRYRAVCDRIDDVLVEIRRYHHEPGMGGGAAAAALAKLTELTKQLKLAKAKMVHGYREHDAGRDVMRQARIRYRALPHHDLATAAERVLFGPQKGQHTLEDGHELDNLIAWRRQDREEKSQAILNEANAKLWAHANQVGGVKFNPDLGEIGGHDPNSVPPSWRRTPVDNGWNDDDLPTDGGGHPYPGGVRSVNGVSAPGPHAGTPGASADSRGPGGVVAPGTWGNGSDGSRPPADPGFIPPGHSAPDGAIPIRMPNGEIGHYVPPGANMNDPRWYGNYKIGGEQGATALVATTGVTGAAAAAAAARAQHLGSAASAGIGGALRTVGAAPAGGNLGAHLGASGGGAASQGAGVRSGGVPGTAGPPGGGAGSNAGGAGMMPGAVAASEAEKEKRRRKGYRVPQLEPEAEDPSKTRFRQLYGMEPPSDPQLEALNARRRAQGLPSYFSERYYQVMGLDVPEEVRQLKKR